MTPSATELVGVERAGAVGTLRLQDADGRNTISTALVDQLQQAADELEADEGIRAVVLAGLPQVFCAGASRTGLDEGWTPEVDALVRLPARIGLPVVAAVRGAAMGGGLVYALHADLVVVGDTTAVAANFMRYGFTPCAGATAVLPRRFGDALGTEMLWTGRPYTGRELSRRGAGVTVVERDAVEATALKVASRIAEAPRDTLQRFKRQLAAPVVQATSEAIGREILDHRATIASSAAREQLARHHPDHEGAA